MTKLLDDDLFNTWYAQQFPDVFPSESPVYETLKMAFDEAYLAGFYRGFRFTVGVFEIKGEDYVST